MKTFYRVNNKWNGQGLWYDYAGDFTGLIHDRFQHWVIKQDSVRVSRIIPLQELLYENHQI